MREVNELNEGGIVIPQSLTESHGKPETDNQLNTKQKENLKALILEFWNVFQEIPGIARGINHQILTPPGQVIYDHWRRLPHHLRPAVKQEIDQMKKLGLIEESQSPWRSLIVVVPKTDGFIRLCIEYHKINEITTFDAFPMPQVDDMLEKVDQAQYISTLDLTKGYWQIPMAAVDRE